MKKLEPRFGIDFNKVEPTSEVIRDCLDRIAGAPGGFAELDDVTNSHIHTVAKRAGYKVRTKKVGNAIRFWVEPSTPGRTGE